MNIRIILVLVQVLVGLGLWFGSGSGSVQGLIVKFPTSRLICSLQTSEKRALEQQKGSACAKKVALEQYGIRLDWSKLTDL